MINIARTHNVSTGGNSDFEKMSSAPPFISAPIGLKFCTCLDGDNTQNRVGTIFEFPETVHHVGGFMQVSHIWCCNVGILKK